MPQVDPAIVLTRLTKKAHPRVLSFISSDFKRGRNMDCEAIAQLLNRFGSGWYREVTDFVKSNSDLKKAVSSCYAVRNSVAHGGTGSLGANRLSELLDLLNAGNQTFRLSVSVHSTPFTATGCGTRFPFGR